MEKYKSFRLIDGKPIQVIVDDNGKIVNRNPNDEELKILKKEPFIGRRQQHTDEKLLEYLRKFHMDTGKVPTSRDFKNNHKYPSCNIYQNRFGSWNNAIELVNLDKLRTKRIVTPKYTDEELLNSLIQFYNETGRVPIENEFGIPSCTTYQRRFGSWSNALKFVGLDVDTMVKKGILDTVDQKARKAEIMVRNHFKNNPIDLSGYNKLSPCDGICPNGKTYDVKGSSLLEYKGWLYWLFNISNKHKEKIEIYYFLAFSIDYTKLKYAWRVPGEMVKKDFYISVSRAESDMKEYDITNKLLDSIGIDIHV